MSKAYMPPAPNEDASTDLPGFLKPAELKKDKDYRAKILAVRELPESTYGAQFGLDILFQGKNRTLAIKMDTPNHRILVEKLGKKGWVGKTVQFRQAFVPRFKKFTIYLVR